MNAQRRKELARIAKRIDAELRALIEEIQSDIDTVKDEEQDAFDNLPESFQEGEKGERAQEALDALQGAYDECETAAYALDEIINYISTATGE